MRLFLFLLCLFTLQVMAQENKYQLKGSLGTNYAEKKKIEFVLQWDEKDGKAIGTYSDNFYTNKAIAKGVTGPLGRIFVVTFPQEIKGVRTITFLGSDLKGQTGAALIPVSVVLRDDVGKPVTTISVEANLIGASEPKMAQRQQEQKCTAGFGALTGYCGVYAGMVTEELDVKNRCNLLALNNTHLILDENSEVGLSFGEINSIVNTPVHRVGRTFIDPKTTKIDLISRSCRPLTGTTFPGDDCKRLNLLGSFSVVRNSKHFSGTYSIIDEKTNESCRYHLSMDQPI